MIYDWMKISYFGEHNVINEIVITLVSSMLFNRAWLNNIAEDGGF